MPDSDLSVPAPGLVLLVDGDDARRAALLAALHGFEVVAASDEASARAAIDARHFELLLSQSRLPGTTGLALARVHAERSPGARRILLAAYEEVPEILGERGGELLFKVIPQSPRAEKLRRLVAEALRGHEEVSVSGVSGTGTLSRQEAEELGRWTAARLTQVQGVVIRQLPQDPLDLELQFVVLRTNRLEALRRDLVKRWLWPLKPRGGKPAPDDRRHPVLRRLGSLSAQSEVYAQPTANGAFLYLALLPWSGESRVTCALGLCTQAPNRELRAIVESAHRSALDEVAEFPVPQLGPDDEVSGAGQPILEYDWIATPDYVGPDRRRAPTSFLNRHIFVGRRKRVPSLLRRKGNWFTDRPPPFVWRYAAAYVALALIDTLLTYQCVRDGTVREANPFLRPLVLHAPVTFFIAKNGIALLAFLVVLRFHLFRRGLHLLRATVLGYLLLDLYWLILIVLVQRGPAQ